MSLDVYLSLNTCNGFWPMGGLFPEQEPVCKKNDKSSQLQSGAEGGMKDDTPDNHPAKPLTGPLYGPISRQNIKTVSK